MIRGAILFLFLAVPAFADGPLFQHKDKFTDQEFENVYHDVDVSDVIIASHAASITALQSVPAVSTTSFVTVGSNTQHVLGIKSFNGQLIGKGTVTNDDAAAGYIGEAVRSYASGNNNFPASNAYGDLTSISLTAGDWDVSIVGRTSTNGASVTDYQFGISFTSGNSATGLDIGDNYAWRLFNTAHTGSFYYFSLPLYRVRLTGTTTVYYKYYATYTSGPPVLTGRISARRVR